ncbi:MAG: hypothetical protein J0H61_11150 [Alphaproteobacteria bacterium]|nr:hypothetical protein [Alphaproteobacteria bacterium]
MLGDDMALLKDATAPLAARRVREHQVLHIAAELSSADNALDRARSEILKWAQRRSGDRFSAEAMLGRNFEMFVAGRNSAAVEVDLPEIHAWALRQEDPDKAVAGRIWTSEAILWRIPDRPPRFAARLTVGSPEVELSIEPAAPGYVRQLIESLGLHNGGTPLLSIPWYISDEPAQEDLLDLLESPRRRLPVIVLSVTDLAKPSSAIDIAKFAAALSGLAFVAVVLPQTSWALTDRFGKRLSVFDHGVRIYMPGFDNDTDPYSHPLWLGSRLANAKDAALIERQIRTHVTQFSVRSVRMGEEILPFAQLRSISRKAEQDRLTSAGASETDQLVAALARIVALEKELAEAKDIEKQAIEEEYQARARAEEAERREHNATVQVQSLLQQLDAADVKPEQNQRLPEEWEGFDEWCDQALAGRVVLTNLARRGCKKAQLSDVQLAARCLLWLAKTCRDRLLNGGGSLRDEPVEDGIRNSPCGSDEFNFDWQSRRMAADWHIKNGSNTREPERCIRIYYGWDDKTQRIIVADMPAHRRTGAT